MKSIISEIRNEMEGAFSSAEGVALKLRLNLAELALARLKENGWTQRKLAGEIGWKESFLSRVLHGDENWTSETAGRLLYALGIDVELSEAKTSALRWRVRAPGGDSQTFTIKLSSTDGQTIPIECVETKAPEG